MQPTQFLAQTLAAAFVFGGAGFVYGLLISGRNEILGFLPGWYETVLGSSCQRPSSFRLKIYHLLTCEKCMAGQFAFWFAPRTFTDWFSFSHFSIVLFSIGTAFFITKLSNR